MGFSRPERNYLALIAETSGARKSSPGTRTRRVLGSYFRPLDEAKTFGKLRFLVCPSNSLSARRPLRDFEYPQREAAFFYGLFLRGHSAEELRRDIEVPAHVLARWHREAEREPSLREVLERMVEYRRHVLAIFDSLIGFDTRITRVQ